MFLPRRDGGMFFKITPMQKDIDSEKAVGGDRGLR